MVGDLVALGAVALVILEVRQPGTIARLAGQVGLSLPGTTVSTAGTGPAAATATGRTEPTPEELATSLGVSTWRVREAMRRTGKTTGQLTLRDFEGIPEVPDSVIVGGVPSHPVAGGQPATWDTPTGSSGTWGGLTDQQIRDSFTATYGSEEAGKAAWEAEHAREVAERGF